jgi:hypothetical protein
LIGDTFAIASTGSFENASDSASKGPGFLRESGLVLDADWVVGHLGSGGSAGLRAHCRGSGDEGVD